MKKLVIGILAHVDAGKTTLSESMLYTSGSIRHLGRVDNKDAYLDNNAMERERGITIFSKQAEFSWKDMAITLLDTPDPVILNRAAGADIHVPVRIPGIELVGFKMAVFHRLFDPLRLERL